MFCCVFLSECLCAARTGAGIWEKLVRSYMIQKQRQRQREAEKEKEGEVKVEEEAEAEIERFLKSQDPRE